MSGPIVRKYGFPNFEAIFGKRELEHGIDGPQPAPQTEPSGKPTPPPAQPEAPGAKPPASK